MAKIRIELKVSGKTVNPIFTIEPGTVVEMDLLREVKKVIGGEVFLPKLKILKRDGIHKFDEDEDEMTGIIDGTIMEVSLERNDAKDRFDKRKREADAAMTETLRLVATAKRELIQPKNITLKRAREVIQHAYVHMDKLLKTLEAAKKGGSDGDTD